MVETAPTMEEWGRLYDLIGQVKALEPWQSMEEIDIFGVQNPENNELGFVSVMGTLGEHYAVSLYLGAAGLYSFWDFQEYGDIGGKELFFQMQHLQASLEDRDQLTKQDRDIIKSLGLKFRGRNAWPQFRSYRPGCFPWYLEAEEARFLACALEQLLDVFPRFQAEADLLVPQDEYHYLVRVPQRKNGGLVWSDQVMEVRPPRPPKFQMPMDMGLLNAVKRLPQRKLKLEIDLFMMPTVIREKNERPYFPYALMIVDESSGMLLGTELMSPVPSMESMWGMVPLTVLQQLAGTGLLPTEIRVSSPRIQLLLERLSRELKIKLFYASVLPNLEDARKALSRFMS